MKAVVWKGIGDTGLEDVPEPKIKDPTDAIIKITASALCGTDLHAIRGTMPGMRPGTILGHEAVGVVEEVGKQVRNLKRGDRVVVPSTIACGHCSYCRDGYHAQCDVANPNGPQAGAAFFGGPRTTGSFDGLQAEYACIPHAAAGLVKLPKEVDDDRAILLSDIFPTAYFGALLAKVGDGDTVAAFGCGPGGQFAITSAQLLGAGRVSAIDQHPDRLKVAQAQGAEVIDFSREDPVGIIGVYPKQVRVFPIGKAMNRNPTINMGNCNYRNYIPKLVEPVRDGAVDPLGVLTVREPMVDAIGACKQFDKPAYGWTKVELAPRG